jgi:hypothetical protein
MRKAVFGFDTKNTIIVAKVHASEVNGGFIHTLASSLWPNVRTRGGVLPESGIRISVIAMQGERAGQLH